MRFHREPRSGLSIPDPGPTDRAVPTVLQEVARRVEDRHRAAAEAAELARQNQRAEQLETLLAPPKHDRRGAHGRGAARIRRRMRLPAHSAPTQALKTIYPWILAPGLGVRGAYIGADVYSLANFEFDPWLLYEAERISAPNIVLTGVIGSGKSALQKSLILRLLAFGVRFSWIQVKPEYETLCSALGVEPMRCGPGQLIRFNPLAEIRRHSSYDAVQHRKDMRLRRLELVSGMIAVWRGHPLTSIERSVLTWALDAVTGEDTATNAELAPVSLPTLLDAVIDTTRWAPAAQRIGIDPQIAADDARDVRLVLGELVHGVLQGMFDSTAPDNAAFDPQAAGTLLDLSAIQQQPKVIALSMTCGKAAMAAELMREDAGRRLMGADEAWLAMREVSFLRAEQEEAKLARWYGISKMWAFHKYGDLEAVGSEGSEQRSLARGLVADADIKICYRQDEVELGRAAEYLDLRDVQKNLLKYLPRGVALWKIKQHVQVVRHLLSSYEIPLTYTDSKMRSVSDVDDVGDDAWEELLEAFYLHSAMTA